MSRRRTPMKGGTLPSFRELADLDTPEGPVDSGAAELASGHGELFLGLPTFTVESPGKGLTQQLLDQLTAPT